MSVASEYGGAVSSVAELVAAARAAAPGVVDGAPETMDASVLAALRPCPELTDAWSHPVGGGDTLEVRGGSGGAPWSAWIQRVGARAPAGQFTCGEPVHVTASVASERMPWWLALGAAWVGYRLARRR